jgi:hypothetical protein
MPEFPPPPPSPLQGPPPLSYGRVTEEQRKARRRRDRVWLIAGCVLAVFALVWFGRVMLQASHEATALVTELHTQMQHHEIDALYAETSSAWKQEVSLEKTQTLFSGIDHKLGAPLSTRQLGIRTEANTSGSLISASYSTRFEQDAEAQESITWKYDDGKFRLIRYHVSSPRFLNP